MGKIAGAAYNMGIGLGLADYQYSVAQIDLGDESLRVTCPPKTGPSKM